MKVFYDIDDLPQFSKSVITVGSFDGVHIGHQKILSRIHQLAQEIKGESVVITFHPHPRQIIYPKDNTLSLLNTLEEKISLMKKFHVDNLVVVPFSIEFSEQHPREYIEKFLLEKFKPRYIVIGYDHRFGKNRMGDIRMLKEYSEANNMVVIEIPKQEIEEIAISSTKIREAIAKSDFDVSNSFLNYHYLLSGEVIEGKKIGTELGYPTANIKIENKYKLLPPDGIYACYARIGNKQHKGMLYIGSKPSIGQNEVRSIEVNIFDFSEILYGEKITVEVVKFIRHDDKFDNLDDLKSQLHLDKIETLQILADSESRTRSINNINIVILNYNGQEYLESYLPDLLYSSEKYKYEITIADNASTDSSIKFLNEYYPEITCINFTKNYGFAEGYNRALINSDAEFTVILNSDVKVTANWLDPIISLMKSDKNIAACQPKVLSLEQPDMFEYAGAGGGYIDTLGYPFCRGRVFEDIEKDDGQYNDTREIFWASGAAMVIRTSLFNKFGGFDPDYFAHQEEIDLCWRMKRAGYKIFYVGESVVYHLGGGTLSYENPQKVFLNFKNNLTTLIKNQPLSSLIWKFPFRLVLDGAAGFLFLVKGKFLNIWAVIKAHFAIYRNLPKILRTKKKTNQLVSKYSVDHPNKKGLFKGSTVFNYYFRGKKQFLE